VIRVHLWTGRAGSIGVVAGVSGSFNSGVGGFARSRIVRQLPAKRRIHTDPCLRSVFGECDQLTGECQDGEQGLGEQLTGPSDWVLV
jgi:hypothetical protein